MLGHQSIVAPRPHQNAGIECGLKAYTQAASSGRWGATFSVVLTSWVLFRATTMQGALSMLSGGRWCDAPPTVAGLISSLPG
jgi:hypothetical protein